MNELEEWINSRPESIKALYKRFPVGTRLEIDGKLIFVVGYQETDREPGLLVSEIDPVAEYDKAIDARFFVCADCLSD
jgi:hypothetical protein